VGLVLEEGEGFADEEGGAGEEGGHFAGGEGAGEVGVDGGGRGVGGEGGQDVGGGDGAGAVEGDEVEFGGEGKEVGEDTGEVFGGDDAEDEARFLIAEFLAPGGGEGCGGGGVVGDVEDEGWVLGDDVEAAGVAGVEEAVFDGFVVEVDAGTVEGGEGEGGILELVGAAEADGVAGEGFFDKLEGGLALIGDLRDDGAGFGGLGGGEDGFGGADDAGFFAGDGGEGIAEPFLVVEGDGGEDGDVGGEGGGGIEAAAHACFEDDEFAGMFVEMFEGDGEGEFEEGGVVIPVGNEFAQGGEVADGVLLGNFGAGDADAFAEVEEVGGGEEADAAAGGAGHGVDDGADGALAVGAGDVDDGGAVGGDGEVFAEESARAVEAEFDAEELG